MVLKVSIPQLDGGPGGDELTDEGLRAALRCVRLRLYRPADAEFALRSGHLDQPWGGGVSAGALAQHVPAQLLDLLRADRLVVMNTGRMCDAAAPGPGLTLRLMSAASDDLEAAIRDEAMALIGCAQLLQVALAALDAVVGS